MKFVALFSLCLHVYASSLHPREDAQPLDASRQSGAANDGEKPPSVTYDVGQPEAKKPRVGPESSNNIASAPSDTDVRPKTPPDSGVFGDEDDWDAQEDTDVRPKTPPDSGVFGDEDDWDARHDTSDAPEGPRGSGRTHDSSRAPLGTEMDTPSTVAGRREKTASGQTVHVTVDAKDNASLARLSRLFDPSFASPVVDPSKTTKIELETLGAATDETSGEGLHKTGMMYKLTDTNEDVVIKWYNQEEFFNAPAGLQRDGLMYTDFYSQSIAHLLSELYNGGVDHAQKVSFMQPLLVTAPGDAPGATRYGLMERRLEHFHYDPPEQSMRRRMDAFHRFLNNEVRFLITQDLQGWYQRDDGHLYMTDTVLEIYDKHDTLAAPQLVSEGSGYDLKQMYDTLITKVQNTRAEGTSSNLGNNEHARTTNTGSIRRIFGASLEDDIATIKQVLGAKICYLRM